MKKFYRIILLLITFIILSTYIPRNLNVVSKKNNKFFKIKNIEVKNNILIDEKLIKNKLLKIHNKSIFFIKVKDIEIALKDIDFLDTFEIKKKYPDTLFIKIYETKPIAILFKNKTKYFLDSSQNLINFDEKKNNKKLPTIFGVNAENNFILFYNQLNNNNFPKNKIKNLYFFQIDRWDLQLTNGQIIKFPGSNVEEAIKKSIKLLDHEDFKNYNTIDLRVDGKIVVE